MMGAGRGLVGAGACDGLSRNDVSILSRGEKNDG